MPRSLAKKEKKKKLEAVSGKLGRVDYPTPDHRIGWKRTSRESYEGAQSPCLAIQNTLIVLDLQKSRSLDSRGPGDQTGQS